MRHALRWAGIVLSIVAGTVLGATGVALGTSAGRAIVVSTALQVVNGAIEGTLTVGWVTGSLRRGLEARQVSVVGRDGVPLVQIPSLSIRYRLRDLVSRRFVLGQVSVESPRVNVVKGRDGRFNFERIFRLGGGKGGGSRPLVAFHDVEIDSGTIWIRVPANSGDTATDEGGLELDGGSRLRRIENFSARLSYVRLSSPFPREDAILADIRDLRARLSDPRLVIRGAAGRAQVWSDSARLDLPRLVLGTSQAKVGGTVGWPADTLMFNLALETRDAALDDVRPLVPAIPRGLDGSGRFTVHSLAGDVLALGAEQMAIVGRHGGGSLTGRAGIVLGPRGSWSVRRADLELADLDLEYVRGIFDTLPVAGRLSGTVKADGPHDHLAVEADVAFRDSLVPGWPVSTARAGGVLRVGDAEGLVFQDVSLGEAKIDLATVRRLVPGIALRGSLGLQGRVSGPWLEVQFDGTLRHVDPPAPETAAHTVIQLDARGDTLGVWAKMSFDSLRLAGLRSLLPDFKVEGAFAGDVLLEGYADSLHFTSDLAGPSGHLAGSGSLILISPHYAVRYLNVRFAALDVHQLFAQAPTTRLNGETRGAIETDTLRASTAAFMVRLDSSLVEQSRIDSMTGTVSLADSVVRIDTLMGWAPDAQFTMAGGLGVRLPRRDSLMIAADLRSLRFLDPALRRILAVPDDSTRQPPSGGVRVRASISGALDDYRIAGNVASSEFQWERWSAHGAQLQGSWSSKARGAVTLAAVMDSLRSGTPEFNSITLRVSGARDSVRWIGRARSGSQSTIMLSGSLVTDSTTVRVPLDSARFTLAAAAWVLEKRTTIVVGDSAIDLGALTLNETSGASRIEAVGSIPMEGHGRLTLSLQTVPLTDLFALAQKDPSGAAGTLAGTIDLAGTARAPQMHAALSMIDVAYGDFRVPAIQGVIDYAGHRLQGEFKLRRAQDVIMDITADLPIDLALRDPAANRQLPGQLKIRAVADSVDLAILEAVSPAVRDASGRLDGDFGITGSWERPQLTGSLNLTSGAATYPGLGVRHQGISGRVVMQGDTLHIERMSGRSGSGTLAVGGNVRLENLTRPVLDLHLSARDFDAMDVRTFLTFTATGEFDLRGPLIGATLSGSGTVPKGILHYTDLVNKRVVNLEDTLFRGLVDTTLIRRQGLGRGLQNRFIDSLIVGSLRLQMGSEVWLRSTEANIQLAGSVVFSKVGDSYRADGVLTTPRGIYQLPLGVQFATRQFTVTRGEIRMLGTPDLNALVDIDAYYLIRRRTGDNMTVYIHIGGTLYVPTITLSSDVRPALPEAEIVSYLMFGGPLIAGTATSQGRQAAVQSFVSALSGQVESALVSNIGLPFDFFQISPPEQGLSGTQVELGWQWDIFGVPAFVTPTSRFGCQQSFIKTENWGLSLELRLSKDWRVAGSIEPVRGCSTTSITPGAGTRQAGVDVLWERNY